VSPFLRVIRPMSMPGPAALHVDCGIRGQDLPLVVTNNTPTSLEVVHPCGYTLSRPSMDSAGLIPLRILLPCGIVRAHLASCGAVRLKHVSYKKNVGWLPSLTE